MRGRGSQAESGEGKPAGEGAKKEPQWFLVTLDVPLLGAGGQSFHQGVLFEDRSLDGVCPKRM